MPVDPKELEASLASVVQELDHLKDGLRLLGVSQCSWCRKYFLARDGSALLDVGELVCYSCVQPWWRERAPALGIEERQAIEHKILRWLVAYHHSKVIRHKDKMPGTDAIELKMVVACEECHGTGTIVGAGECRNCDGRGSVWVVGLRPELL